VLRRIVFAWLPHTQTRDIKQAAFFRIFS